MDPARIEHCSAVVRRRFPALFQGEIYLENAGGSQVPACVADAVHHHLTHHYVNSGAGYAASRAATEVIRAAHRFIHGFMGGGADGCVALGPSSSVLCRALADSIAERLTPGDEIIVAGNGHEANAGCWLRLARRGLTVRTWPVEGEPAGCRLETLEKLLTSRTRIVAFPHVSNILGEVADVAAITRAVHAAGAQVVVDGVAYAPHLPMRVAEWDVDWYVYSTYKVFGPHMAALYGKTERFLEIEGCNHFFTSRAKPEARLELGGACPEGCAGLLGLGAYLEDLAELEADAARFTMNTGTSDHPAHGPRVRSEAAGGLRPLPEYAETTAAVFAAAWRVMSAIEAPVAEGLLRFLAGKPRVRILGPGEPGPTRIGLVSFVHERLTPAEIVARTDQAGIGIKSGHMSAWRLVEALGLDPRSGVVRVSIAHYNTAAEIERLIEVLDPVL